MELETLDDTEVLEREVSVEISEFDSGIEVDACADSVACGPLLVEGSESGGVTGGVFKDGFAMNLITSTMAAIWTADVEIAV